MLEFHSIYLSFCYNVIVPNFHEGKLRYCDIDIAHWRSQTNDSDNSIITFTSQLFSFIEDALIHGESVLIHCLAGAHRAGTTAISCLIHFARKFDLTSCVHDFGMISIVHSFCSLFSFLLVLCLFAAMYIELEVAKAIAVAKLCRPIIDPLGDFPIFLERLYTAEKNRGIRPFTSAASMGGILCKLLGCSISRSTRINSSTVAPVNSCRDGGQTLTLSNTTPYENSKCGGEMYCMPDSSNETSGQGGAVVVGEYPHVKNHDHFTNSYYDETSRRSNNGNNTSSNGVVQSMH